MGELYSGALRGGVNVRRFRPHVPKFMTSVFGIGNPLMDSLYHVGTATLVSLDATPGVMELVSADRINQLRAALGEPYRIAGGSCANTMRGLAWLSAQQPAKAAAQPGAAVAARFTGVVAADDSGLAYERAMQEAGVAATLPRQDGQTGASLVLVTPDGERTMYTDLGVSLLLRKEHVDTAALEAADAFYATGYLFDGAGELEALDTAAAVAKAANVPFVFDVADPFVIDRHRDALAAWMPGRVDVLIGNRSELRMLTGADSDPEALDAARAIAPLTVMKTGAEGALVRDSEGAIEHAPAAAVEARDTTGAGDSFAAGFLHCWLAGGTPLEACARGNTLAAGIVTVDGCDYSKLPPLS